MTRRVPARDTREEINLVFRNGNHNSEDDLPPPPLSLQIAIKGGPQTEGNTVHAGEFDQLANLSR